jgi:quinol monooxygenase YgiN
MPLTRRRRRATFFDAQQRGFLWVWSYSEGMLHEKVYVSIRSISVMSGSEHALQATIEAKPEKSEEVKEFLESAASMAEDEEKTTTWFALRFDETTFGIFDTFPDEEGRQAHLEGEIAAQLMESSDELLASDPKIEEVDVLAAKHP